MTTPKKIAIIGAGIAGVTAAYQLALRGHSITIFDKERYPAMATSYANGSQLSVCNSPTWNTWDNVIKGLKWITKKDAPFHISPSIDPDKISWLTRFLITTAKNTWKENTARTIKLALDSRKETLAIADREHIDFDLVKRGILHVYSSKDSFQKAFKLEKLMTDNGCEWTPLDVKSCAMYEPSLESNMHLVGGIMTRDDSTGDLHKFVCGLSDILSRKYSVRFCFNQYITDMHVSNHGIVINDEPYDDLVIAAGVDSQKFSKQLGDNLGIYPVKGYSITIDLDASSQSAAPWTSLLDDDKKIVVARLGQDRLRVAGTAELVGYNRDIQMHRVAPLLSWVKDWFPDINTRSYKPWAGLRPMSSDMMPQIKRGKNPRVWYHTGAGHLGWTLSAGTSVILADMIEKG